MKIYFRFVIFQWCSKTNQYIHWFRYCMLNMSIKTPPPSTFSNFTAQEYKVIFFFHWMNCTSWYDTSLSLLAITISSLVFSDRQQRHFLSIPSQIRNISFGPTLFIGRQIIFLGIPLFNFLVLYTLHVHNSKRFHLSSYWQVRCGLGWMFDVHIESIKRQCIQHSVFQVSNLSRFSPMWSIKCNFDEFNKV